MFRETKRVTIVGLIGAIVLSLLATSGRAFCAAGENQNPIPPGTIITPQNWQKYKQYMSDGLQVLFAGQHFWKMPPDFQMVVSAYKSYPLPKIYVENTEKYAKDVKIVTTSDGGHNLSGYVAGLPFPNPQEPLRGWKLLVDDWYAYQPHEICATQSKVWFHDRLLNESTLNQIFLLRRMSHISDPGEPIYEPRGKGEDLVQYAQILQPEQARYTTLFNVYYEDLSKPQDTYLFIPALRRSLRLSTAARCAPFFGGDFTNDDTRHGAFNGNMTHFDADFVADRQILEAPDVTQDLSKLVNPRNYFQPLFFGKPTLETWEVRPVWMINVHPIPKYTPGYCYSKRILYVDKEDYQAMWADLYDDGGKFWKVDYDPQGMVSVPGVGEAWTNTGWGTMWDEQAGHLTMAEVQMLANQNCNGPNGENYTDIGRYFSLSALSQIMR